MDLTSGIVTVRGPDRTTPSTPGSTLKPLVIWIALRRHLVTPQTRLACSGPLHVTGRNLACSHPASLGVLDLREALAYSCNTYFARIARQMPASDLQSGLQQFGIRAAAPQDTPERRILRVLGLEQVAVTPEQMAQTYAKLARELEHDGPEAAAVRAGLLDSVEYGMANAAQTEGVVLGGKTGTAHDQSGVRQHGWFAGIIFTRTGRLHASHVLAVYAPGGSGNDAAVTAHEYLVRAKQGRR